MPDETNETGGPPGKRADWNKNVRIVQMRDLGPTLPIGTPDPATGALVKTIEHRRWNLRIEKEIGEFREGNRRENMGTFAASIVAKVCTRLGGLVLTGDKQKLDQDVAQVSSMWLTDVLYAWFWLRFNILGPTLWFDVRCPHCGARTKVPADLSTLEVRCVDCLEDTYWDYELLEPIELRGRTVEKLRIGCARWSVIQQIGGELNTGAMKAGMILDSIHSAEGLDAVKLVAHELEELGKPDIERLTAGLDRHNIGPDVAVETDCGQCRNQFRSTIDWAYDSFFSDSGRSSP